jgi:hypothetical protein
MNKQTQPCDIHPPPPHPLTHSQSQNPGLNRKESLWQQSFYKLLLHPQRLQPFPTQTRNNTNSNALRRRVSSLWDLCESAVGRPKQRLLGYLSGEKARRSHGGGGKRMAQVHDFDGDDYYYGSVCGN